MGSLCKRSAALLLVFLVLSGCSRRGGDSTPKSFEVSPTAAYAYLTLSQMGIDPEAMKLHATAQMPPLKQLQSTAAAFGQSYSPITMQQYLQRSKRSSAAVIENTNGELHTAIGAVALDGEEFIQILQQGQPRLVPIADLRRLPVANVWTTSRADTTAVKLSVGAGTLALDKLWHNFGFTEPFSELTADFGISNQGNVSIRFDGASTSCGCIIADFPTEKVLHPGEAVPLKVLLKTHDKTAHSQSIHLRAVETASKASRTITLALFANQFGVLAVAPERIHFGKVDHAEAASERTVQLIPTEHDQFRVAKIDAGDLPVRSSLLPIGDTINGIPSKGYALKLTLDASNSSAGTHRANIKIMTTSKYRPLLELPIEFTVRTAVEPIPSVAAFGVVESGSQKEQRIVLMPLNGHSFDAEIAEQSADCTAMIERSDKSVILVVKPTFSQIGPYARQILVHVSSGSRTDVLKIECVATVVKER